MVDDSTSGLISPALAIFKCRSTDFAAAVTRVLVEVGFKMRSRIDPEALMCVRILMWCARSRQKLFNPDWSQGGGETVCSRGLKSPVGILSMIFWSWNVRKSARSLLFLVCGVELL